MSTLRVNNLKSRTGTAVTITSGHGLDVEGNLKITGVSTFSGITSFTNGANVTGVVTFANVDIQNGNTNFTGIVTAKTFHGNIVGTAATFSGAVTYEDVTNVDSIGVVTARGGIKIGVAGAGGTITSAGAAEFAGIVTASKFYGDGANLTGIGGTANIVSDAITVQGTVGVITASNFAPRGGTDYVTTGWRNLVINGGQDIIQRRGSGTGARSNPDAKYITDRFWTTTYRSGSDANQVSASVNNGEFTKTLRYTNDSGSSPGASNTASINYCVEGYDAKQLKFGTSAAVPVTVSFWIKVNNTGNSFPQKHCVAISNATGKTYTSNMDRTFVREYDIAADATWQYVSLTFPGCTNGTWNNTTSSGLTITWDMGSGANYHGTKDTWQSTNDFKTIQVGNFCETNSFQMHITGVQLEKGEVATPFEHRPRALELAMCKRYYEVIKGSDWSGNEGLCGVGHKYTSSRVFWNEHFQVEKRVNPTQALINNAWGAGTISHCNVLEGQSWRNAGTFTAGPVSVDRARVDWSGFGNIFDVDDACECRIQGATNLEFEADI